MGTGDNVANVDLPVSATAHLAPDMPKAKFPSIFYAIDVYRAFCRKFISRMVMPPAYHSGPSHDKLN